MKVAVYTSYGHPEVVQLKDMPKPNPNNNEIVVKVNASTVTAGDWRMRAGNPFAIRLYNGLFKLKRTVLGHEFSGVVDSVGGDVTLFKKGMPFLVIRAQMPVPMPNMWPCLRMGLFRKDQPTLTINRQLPYQWVLPLLCIFSEKPISNRPKKF